MVAHYQAIYQGPLVQQSDTVENFCKGTRYASYGDSKHHLIQGRGRKGCTRGVKRAEQQALLHMLTQYVKVRGC